MYVPSLIVFKEMLWQTLDWTGVTLRDYIRWPIQAVLSVSISDIKCLHLHIPHSVEARSGIVLLIVSPEIIYSLNIPALHLQLQQHKNIKPPSLPPSICLLKLNIANLFYFVSRPGQARRGEEGNMASLRSTKSPHAILYVCAWPGLAPRYFHQYLDKKYSGLKSAELIFKVDRRISSIEFICTA